MNDLSKEAILEIAKLSHATDGPRTVTGGNIPYALVPDCYRVEPMGHLIFNDHCKAPDRVRTTVTVLDPASFMEYYSKFADPNSKVFADELQLAITGVLDYHAPDDGPRWGSHKIALKLRKSEEWNTWMGMNNKQMTQQTFAEFLEQNSLDVTKPSPTHMMEIASDLQATTDVEFGSGLRQQDGQVRFKYTETIKTTVGGGSMSVPERFTISIPPFVGGSVVPMEALLRFRVKESKLTFFYTLVRPEAVLRAAFKASSDLIASTLKIVVLNGSIA